MASSHDLGKRRPEPVGASSDGHDLKPDPASARTIDELEDVLRTYWRWAGRPSVRTVAQRSDGAFAHSTVSKILNNRPGKPPLKLAYVQGCIRGFGGDDQEVQRWATAWRSLQLQPTQRAEEREADSPGAGSTALIASSGQAVEEGAWTRLDTVIRPVRHARPGDPAMGLGVPRVMTAFDIAMFSGPQYSDEVRGYLRDTFATMLRESFQECDVSWSDAHVEDRGDGALVILPPGVPTELLLTPFAEMLNGRLRAHNRFASETARFQLRMAVDAGHVQFDTHGVAGQPVLRLFRMLDAPNFKRAFSDSGSDLGLIVSTPVYEEVVRTGPGPSDPARFHALHVEVKETALQAWACFFDGDASRRLPEDPRNQLSDAERRVAEAAARGLTNRQISERLSITVGTVEQHLTRIYRKLKVHQRSDLAYALLPGGGTPALPPGR